MRTIRIYQPSPLTLQQETALDKEAANHVVNVLRMQAGQAIQLFNGEGGAYQGELVSVSKKHCTVHLSEFDDTDVESPLQVHLAQGVSRGERMDYTIQKAVELGVSSITPIFTERCNVKLSGDRLDKKQQHWQKVAISACEQSGRNRVPQIHPAMSVEQWLAQPCELGLVLHHRHAQTLKHIAYSTGQSVQLLIGSEGGLTEYEIEQAIQQGYQALQLGPRVLRTETAALVALSLLQLQWGDF